MGKDLLIKYKDNEFHLGRASAFEFDQQLITDEDLIDNELAKVARSLKTEMKLHASYTPKDLAELYKITADIDEKIHDAMEDILKVGRMYMLAGLLDQGFSVDYSI